MKTINVEDVRLTFGRDCTCGDMPESTTAGIEDLLISGTPICGECGTEYVLITTELVEDDDKVSDEPVKILDFEVDEHYNHQDFIKDDEEDYIFKSGTGIFEYKGEKYTFTFSYTLRDFPDWEFIPDISDKGLITEELDEIEKFFDELDRNKFVADFIGEGY